jgi:hypothetical protein
VQNDLYVQRPQLRAKNVRIRGDAVRRFDRRRSVRGCAGSDADAGLRYWVGQISPVLAERVTVEKLDDAHIAI